MFEPHLCTSREDAWRSVWDLLFTLAALTLAGAVVYVVCAVVFGALGI